MNGPEAVLTDLVTLLRDKTNGINAKIAAQGWTDPVVPLVTSDQHITIGDRNAFEEYPAIEVMWMPSVVQDDIHSRLDVVYGVGVRFYVAEDEHPKLDLVAARFAKALILTLWNARESNLFASVLSSGGNTIRFEGGTWQQSDVRRNQNNQLERDVLIPFHAWVAESMP